MSSERIIYLNGEYVPEHEAKVSVLDRGFRWGDAVYDALRTFDGRPFKMNHFQAEFEAKAVDPDAFALMLDIDGNIAESSGSDFLFVSDGALRIPQRRTHLTGASLLTVTELAEKNGMRTDEGAFTLFDLYNAEEAMLTASTFCLLPVVRVNGMTATPAAILSRPRCRRSAKRPCPSPRTGSLAAARGLGPPRATGPASGRAPVSSPSGSGRQPRTGARFERDRR